MPTIILRAGEAAPGDIRVLDVVSGLSTAVTIIYLDTLEAFANDIKLKDPSAQPANNVNALSATGISSDNPTVGTPALGQTHALVATDIATTAPSVGAPALGQTHVLVATGIATTAPSVDSPALGQVHALSATGIATTAPTVGAPVLGQAHAFSSAELATAAPTVGSPAIGQTHALSPTAIDTTAPTVGAPALGGSSVSEIVLFGGGMSLNKARPKVTAHLEAISVSSDAPLLGNPLLGQVHGLDSAEFESVTHLLDAPKVRIQIPIGVVLRQSAPIRVEVQASTTIQIQSRESIGIRLHALADRLEIESRVKQIPVDGGHYRFHLGGVVQIILAPRTESV